MLPRAEEFGIRIAPEIHSPTPLRSKIVDDYLDLARQTEHFGLLIDTGIFQTAERRPRPQRLASTSSATLARAAAQVAREMSKPLAGRRTTCPS